SRRRHTRWPRDWSSDVCSSDLRNNLNSALSKIRICLQATRANRFGFSTAHYSNYFAGPGRLLESRVRSAKSTEPARQLKRRAPRSEERRVGKKNRSKM